MPVTIAALILALLVDTVAASAETSRTPDEANARLIEATASLSRDLTEVTRPSRWLADEDRTARLRARLEHIDAALGNALTEVETALHPIIGRVDEPEVASAIAQRLLEAHPGDRNAHRRLLGAWVLFREVSSRARRVRMEIGRGLGLNLDPFGRTCPVAGWHRYEHDWGEERPWGRDHKGIDLVAEHGTPLIAIERGTITQADWHWAGGFGIYVHGTTTGQDYYYAHLAGYAPGIDAGDAVDAGELLGWVGSTGNATTPHLHFGWMPDGGGLDSLQDPYPLIESLCW